MSERTLFKFHGKFKDLIPAGWKFQKLFANNYRQYSIEPAPIKVDTIRVWQHHGGYVEINDFFGRSEAVIRYIVDNGPVDAVSTPMLNLKTGQVEAYDREKHSDIKIFIEWEKDKETLKAKMREFHDTYRRCNLEDETIEYLKKMVEWGWIKV